MSCFTNPTTLFHGKITTTTRNHHQRRRTLPNPIILSLSGEERKTHRRNIVTTLLATSVALGLCPYATPIAMAQNWGTHSWLKEKFFQPGLSPEDAVLRIRQTAEGLHDMREMMDTMSWRYVMFYIRLKQAYLSQDMGNAMSMVAENRKESYVTKANELVENMAEFDRYIRTPKVYESYLYYEKTLKSIDDLVTILA